jgi:predicted transcriptional regulator
VGSRPDKGPLAPPSGREDAQERVERRSKLSILRDILRTINNKGGKAKPTHILYGANLSHDRLKKYLESLEKEGFLKKVGAGPGSEVKGQTMYEITKKGVEFLSGYNKMKDFFDAFGISI